MGSVLILNMSKSHSSFPGSSLFFNEFLVIFAIEITIMLNIFLRLIPFFLLVSDPKAPPCEYRDWLAKMSGKYDAGAYMAMFK